MKLKQALSNIFQVKGHSTVIGAVMNRDFSSIQDVDIIEKSLKELEEELKKTINAQDNCGSDWAYWGYEGTIGYLRSAVNILKAADIMGENDLADIPPPAKEGIVMDLISDIERYGEKIYNEALKARKLAKIIAEREIKKNLTNNPS